MKKFLSIFVVLFVFLFALTSCDFLDSTSTTDSGNTKTTETTQESKKDYKIPNSYSYYEGKDYKEVEAKLKESGFENFEVERLGNLITGFLHKANEISKMSVDGDEKFKSGTYDKNVKIKFSVYSYDNQCPEGHELTKQIAKDSTCSSIGLTTDAYYCATCDEYFKDSKGNKFDASSNVIIAKKDHVLKHVDGEESTCSKVGVVEHYECENCHGLFLDDKATQSCTTEEVTIAKKEHTIVIDEGRRPVSVNEPGLTEGSHCSVCGQVIVSQTFIKWEGCEEERALASELEKTFPQESAKRAAVASITNYFALDVFDSTGNNVDKTKFHNYSDTTNHPENYYMYLIDEGTYSYKSDNTWFIREIKVRSYRYKTEHIINMYVTFDGSKYVTSHWVDARDVSSSQKVVYESSSDAYEVLPSMIVNDRSKTAEAALDHSSELLESTAYRLLQEYLVQVTGDKVNVEEYFGNHGSYQNWDGSWIVDVDCEFKTTAGGKYKKRVQAIIHVNKTVELVAVYNI